MGLLSITDHINEVGPISRVLFCKQVHFRSKKDEWGDCYRYQIAEWIFPYVLSLIAMYYSSFIIHTLFVFFCSAQNCFNKKE